MATYQNHLDRVFEIASKAGARCIQQQNVDRGTDRKSANMLRFSTTKGSVIVILYPDPDSGVEHFVEGGAKWADLEHDMGVPSEA